MTISPKICPLIAFIDAKLSSLLNKTISAGGAAYPFNFALTARKRIASKTCSYKDSIKNAQL